jgi:uncharacterized protein YjbJ (UPF0337 family)
MDMDRLKGAAQDAGGKLQQGFGELTGDRSTQAEGMARQIGGKAQGLFGEAKDQVRDVAGDAVDSIEKYPLLSLLAAAGLGFLVSMLLSDHNDRRYRRR